jgi:2-polyprenyl-6-hydroxyphenyl methylase/3-demethylubiquinone-9 3-methyltransferase
MAQSVNVDARETEKFSRWDSQWWDPNGPMHSLHAINPLRTSFIARDLDLRGQRALDVGCGGGLLTESLSRLGARVTGIDLSEDLVALATSHARHQGLDIDYRNVGAEQLAERQPGTFDLVTCMEVLEHLPRPREVVAACSRLLKPGGDAFFATLDRTPKSFLFAIVGAEYILHLLPIGSHTFGRLIRPQELSAWAEGSALEYVRSAGVTYDLITRKFSVAEHPDVSYMTHFRKK